VAVTPSGAASSSRVVMRTCIGCRQRAIAAELLRVVAGPAPQNAAGNSARTVVPDPRRRAAGRGAWLHPIAECVALAERRRAFGRALRFATATDPTPVREYVASLAGR
jgi:predicted RNA-binding protein YlxR (DUF448 family)